MPLPTADSGSHLHSVSPLPPDEGFARPGSKASGQKLWHWLLPLGYCFSLIFANVFRPVSLFDETIPLVDGTLLQRGLIPHVDFFSLYPPFPYFVYADLFSLFHRTVLLERLLVVAVYLLLLFSLWQTLRSRFRDAIQSHAILMTLIIAVIGSQFLEQPVWYAFAAALLLLVWFAKQMQLEEKGRPGIFAVLGAGTALVILCRINIGCYLLLAIVIDIGVRWFERHRTGGPRTSTATRAMRRVCLAYAAGLAVTLGGFLLSYGKDMAAPLTQAVFIMARLAGTQRFIPLSLSSSLYPLLLIFPIIWFGFRLADTDGNDTSTPRKLAVVGVTAIAYLVLLNVFAASEQVLPKLWLFPLAAALLFHRYVKQLGRIEFPVLVFYCISLHYGLTRADDYHFLALLPIIALLLPYAMLFNQPSRQRTVGAWYAFCFVLMVVRLVDVVPNPGRMNEAAELIYSGNLLNGESDSERLMGSSNFPHAWQALYPNLDEWQALHFVYQRTKPDSFVFIGVTRHYDVFMSDVRAYWLLGRRVGVWSYVLEPGLATEADVQSGMATDLQRNRVNWIILVENPAPTDQAFVERNYHGSVLLDEYIAARYRPVFRAGAYHVLQARQPSR